MAGTSPRPVAVAGNSAEDASTEMTDVESVRMQLRQRWELASVLNFLHVFHPIIGKDLKLSAEDVETAIIEQNSTLAQLHIGLLKGILSPNQAQKLKSTDSWVVSLSNTLSTWWPWVAEGDFPLTGPKGEKISIYKELEPTARLVILKAVCEVRADQYDVVSYINEKLKNGTELSFFRKEKLASDGDRVSFWYDGSETIGHRLYKEVHFFEKRGAKSKGTVPAINYHWETLATNLEEFHNIANEFSASKSTWEVDLSKSIETDVIPVLEKQWQKKQRAENRKQREQLLQDDFRNSITTRACRNSKHVDYKFDNYDKAIRNAIKYANKRKTTEEPVEEEKPSQKRATSTSNGSNDSTKTSSDGESTDTESSNHEESDVDDSNDEAYVEEKEDDSKMDMGGDEGKANNMKQNMPLVYRPKGNRFSKRLARVPDHTIPESVNLGLKNQLRQRPSVNTAVEHSVVPDSEDESSSGGKS